MTENFKVIPLQQGRFIQLTGPLFPSGDTLTRNEAIQLTRELTAALKATAPLEIPEAGR